MNRVQRISAYALLREEDSILLCRLSSLLGADQGRWTLPGGGLRFGEHPVDGVVREVIEETGLTIETTGVATVDSQVFETEMRRLQALRIVYWGQVLSGTLRNETQGSTDLCQWFTRHEAASLPLVPLARLGLEIAFGKDSGRSSHAAVER